MCMYCEKGKEIRNDNNIKSFISKAHFGYSIISQISNNCFNLGFINYCPMCRKEARRVNKEEIVQRLKFTSDEINKDIKRFEETHNFEYIYDYNIYSTKEFIDELIDAMEDKQC